MSPGLTSALTLLPLMSPQAADTNGLRFEIRPRFEVDYSAFSPGEVDDELDADFRPGAAFRRARLDIRGYWKDALSARWNVEFADGFVDTKDVWIQLADTPAGRLRAGYFRVPFGLEALTSAKFVTFIERSSPTNAFTPGRDLGLSVGDRFGDGRGSWAASAFTLAEGVQQNVEGGDHAFAARLTWLPVLVDEGHLLHVGAAVSARDADDGAERFDARPEADRVDRLLDTGSFAADSTRLAGLELAWIDGPFSLQGELFHAAVDSSENGDPNLGGWYAQGSYFLTGEHRAYDFGKSSFKGVVPDSPWRAGGPGAWELALRLSHTDLEDGNVMGNELWNYALGVNWYQDRAMRVMFNYVRTVLDGPDEGADLFLFRWQVTF